MRFDQLECYIAFAFILASVFLVILNITLFFIIFKLLDVKAIDSNKEEKLLDGKEEV